MVKAVMAEKQRIVSLKSSCQSRWSEQMDSGYRANGQRWVMNVVYLWCW